MRSSSEFSARQFSNTQSIAGWKPENGNDARRGSGNISAFCSSQVHDDLAETGSMPTTFALIRLSLLLL